MLVHDSIAVSSRCVVSSIRNAISPAISLAVAFNCTVVSHFSSSSICALYTISTMSILSTIAFVCTTTFHTFSSMGPSSSTYMSGSSEHNFAIVFLILSLRSCRSDFSISIFYVVSLLPENSIFCPNYLFSIIEFLSDFFLQGLQCF